MDAIPALTPASGPATLPDVRGQLLGCNADLLARCLLEAEANHAGASELPGPAVRYGLVRQISDALALMEGCEEQRPLEGAFVALEWYEAAGANGLLRRVGAALATPEVIAESSSLLERTGGYAYELGEVRAAERLVPDVAFGASWSWQSLRGSLGQLADVPWGRILATPLLLPDRLCAKERYGALGQVLWGMTHRGFGIEGARTAASAVGARASGPPLGPKARADGFVERSWSLAAYRPDEFEGPWLRQLERVARLLNYNCWVRFLEDCAALGKAAGKQD